MKGHILYAHKYEHSTVNPLRSQSSLGKHIGKLTHLTDLTAALQIK